MLITLVLFLLGNLVRAYFEGLDLHFLIGNFKNDPQILKIFLVFWVAYNFGSIRAIKFF